MNSKLILNLLFIVFLAGWSATMITSCAKEEFDVTTGGEFGPASYDALQALISEVESYLATAEEGINAGNHPPGSIDAFTVFLDNAKEVITKGLNQTLTDRALDVLQSEFDAFRANVVGPANPWIQQSQSTYIQVTDAKSLLNDNFTIEAKVYPVSLQQSGFSNVLFSNAMGAGGENDRGTVARYFSDGHMEFIVGGSAEGWKQGTTNAGVLQAGQWNHVSLVISNSDGHRLYVNGQEAATLTNGEPYQNSDPEFPLTIGNAFPWQERTMNGMVRDFRVWSSARSASEIQDNLDAELTGTENNLELFFPLDANLGQEFADLTGNYTATFVGDIVWVPDGNIGTIELDYASINGAIGAAQEVLGSATFGENDGDYPSDAKPFIEKLIAGANALIDDPLATQSDLNGMAQSITDALALIKENLVADSEGIKVDAQTDAVGLRVTPTYSPTGSFTIELEVNIESYRASCCGQGNIFGNGSYGLIYGAYDDPDDADQVTGSGTLYFFIRNEGGYDGARAPAFSLRAQEWQHVALVYDASSLTSYIFVNSMLVGEFTGRQIPDPVDWGEMWIGNTWVKMDGSIRDFRFWNEAKNVADLDADIDGSEQNLEMYFPLDRVKGINFSDATGTYNGEFRGSVLWNK